MKPSHISSLSPTALGAILVFAILSGWETRLAAQQVGPNQSAQRLVEAAPRNVFPSERVPAGSRLPDTAVPGGYTPLDARPEPAPAWRAPPAPGRFPEEYTPEEQV